MRATRFILLVPLLLCAQGCMEVFYGGFRTADVSPGRSLPHYSLGDRSIGIAVTKDGSDQENYAGGFWSLVPYDGGRGTPWDPSPPSHWSFQEQVQKAFEQSGLFREVVLGEDATDLSVHIEIQTKFEYGGAMGITTSGILFLLGWPAVFDVTELTVKTTFQGGKRTGTLERRTAVKRRGHLLMPLLYPFRGHPERAVRDAFFDLVSATILEADHEGFFD